MIVPHSIRHIENRFSPYLFFLVFNAVWALTSGGFRIVSDTLVINTSSLSPRLEDAYSVRILFF